MGVSLHTSQSQVMSPLWLATLLLSVLAVQGQQELQDFLGSCLGSQPSSAKINACLVQLAEKLRPFMKTGIAELGIPRTEPMDIDRINFALKSPFGVVDVVFTENSVAGLSNHEVKSVEATIKVIEATATGLYHMSGVIGPLELDPSLAPAPYKTTFTGTTVSGVAQLTEQNGKLIILGEPDVTIAVEGLNVQMENLFGGDADGLAKVVLKFVNKESDKFIQDFQPEIAKQVSGLIKGFFNSALENIPASTFA